MNRVAELLEMVPPPLMRMTFHWSAVEAELGYALPEDYKWIVGTYGFGSFNNEIRIWAPGTPDDLVENTRFTIEQLAIGNISVPDDVSAYIPWGDTGDAVFGLWYMTDVDPNRWQILLADTSRQLLYPGGLLDCLVDILAGNFEADELWADGIPPPPKFVPAQFEVVEGPYLSLRG